MPQGGHSGPLLLGPRVPRTSLPAVQQSPARSGPSAFVEAVGSEGHEGAAWHTFTRTGVWVLFHATEAFASVAQCDHDRIAWSLNPRRPVLVGGPPPPGQSAALTRQDLERNLGATMQQCVPGCMGFQCVVGAKALQCQLLFPLSSICAGDLHMQRRVQSIFQ